MVTASFIPKMMSGACLETISHVTGKCQSEVVQNEKGRSNTSPRSVTEISASAIAIYAVKKTN